MVIDAMGRGGGGEGWAKNFGKLVEQQCPKGVSCDGSDGGRGRVRGGRSSNAGERGKAGGVDETLATNINQQVVSAKEIRAKDGGRTSAMISKAAYRLPPKVTEVETEL
jgi:hypothetical protein